MFTILLAWISAKYEYDCEILFVATFFLDMIIVIGIFSLLGGR